MTNPIIQLTDISASYDEKTVLSHVNLMVYERDFLGVIGPNGGGKTTLIKIILGLLKPASGSVRFYKNEKEVPEIAMGYLPQYNSIDKKFPISVYEVVLSGLNKQKSLFHRYTPEQHELVSRIIARMGLEGLEVVILDEPNTYIDKRFEAKLYSLLEEINKERAIILVSHDIGTVLQNVKTIACVNETLDYHPDTEVPTEWLEEHFGCPIELLGHGNFPHRILKCHHHDE